MMKFKEYTFKRVGRVREATFMFVVALKPYAARVFRRF